MSVLISVAGGFQLIKFKEKEEADEYLREHLEAGNAVLYIPDDTKIDATLRQYKIKRSDVDFL